MQVLDARIRQRRDHRGQQQRDQQRGEHELHASRDVHPERVAERHDGHQHDRRDQRDGLSAAERGGHIGAAKDRRSRRPRGHGEIKAPADHGRGLRAERAAHIRGDAARIRIARAERGEGRGERRGKQDEREPGEQRRRAGDVGGERGQGDDAGAEHRADVERGALHDGQLTGCVGGGVARVQGGFGHVRIDRCFSR
jgi:hypothetical protein